MMARLQTNILFWNICKNQPAQQIVSIVGHYDVDVVLLAESGYTGQPQDLLAALNAPAVGRTRKFREVEESRTSKVHIFSRLGARVWKRLLSRSRYDIWRLRLGSANYLYLATAHFPDVRNEQGDGQRKTAIDLRLDIEALETKYSQQAGARGFTGLPLAVIGDLNASPFDEGIAAIYGLNANQRREVAREGTRTMNNIHYPFLYNPMWQFFGARDGEATGTYHKRLSKPISYDWYILDQVLLRPALLDRVQDSDVRIIEHTGPGMASLVGTDRRPIRGFSDHLPILVRIRI